MFKIKEQLNPRDAFELSHPEEIYLNAVELGCTHYNQGLHLLQSQYPHTNLGPETTKNTYS